MADRPTGVGRFLEGLLSGLTDCDSGWEYVLLFRGEPFDHSLWQQPNISPRFYRRQGMSSVAFEQFWLPFRLPDVDLFVGPAYSLPGRLRCPSLVVIFDLSFELLSGEFPWREKWRRRLLARSAARRASRVLTASASVAHELAREYGIDMGKIGILSPGVNLEMISDELDPGGLEPSLRWPYLLALGTILPRRRIDLLLKAFSRLRREHPDLRLVLAGSNRLRRPRDLDDWIERLQLEEVVLRLGYVPDRSLVQLMRDAEICYYLSSYEGSGLPPLESLAAGTAPVVAAAPGLLELWPDYPYRCESLTADEILRVSRRALDGRDERARIETEGRSRVADLSWRRSAEGFLTQLKRVGME